MSGSRNRKSITFVSPLGLPLLLKPPEAGPGGAERQFFLYARGLKKRGWDVYFITDNNVHDKNKETAMPVEMASFSFMRGGKRRMLFDSMSILYAMWRANSHYYVLKTPAYLLVPMRIFTLIFRRKLVFWAQMEFDAHPQLRPSRGPVSVLVDMGTRQADIILAQNRSQLEGFQENFGKQAKLIKNISGDLSEKHGQPGNDKTIVDVLWIGNSMAKKRYEIVVALAKLLPDRSFAIAMNKADHTRYMEAEMKCRSVQNIDFLGEVNPVEMESWYGKARLLLNTSTQEGFPNTFLQAWQRGMPVVSLCVDPDDVLSKYDLGVIVDRNLTKLVAGDEERCAGMLVAPVEKLLADGATYRQISKNAKAYITEHHGEGVLVERLESILLQG